MNHFFVSPSQVREGTIIIEGGDVNHIRNVLRMKRGEFLEVSDGTGNRYLCELERMEADACFANVMDVWEDDVEPAARIFLFQGLPKGDKMELIIQKAVELGVFEIIPVATRRSVVRLDEKKADKKVARWRAIAEGAAKQSGRGIVPEVRGVTEFEDALERAREMDVCLIPYEKAKGMQKTREALDRVAPGKSVAVFIGPEGGFEGAEIERARESGALPISLGKRILRTETAGFTVLAILMYHLECL
ncbi:MAG: 16S rRNA (uracil(1498)-N(3))-methyltransferase [Ruminococcus sp.]|nr:16S rRNA (uracil(1498)-N(3))-methyltransferase [Ruminococcus sp.]